MKKKETGENNHLGPIFRLVRQTPRGGCQFSLFVAFLNTYIDYSEHQVSDGQDGGLKGLLLFVGELFDHCPMVATEKRRNCMK